MTSTVAVIPTKGRPEDKAEFGARTESYGYALRDLLGLPRIDAAAPSGRDDTNYEPRGRAPAAAPTPPRNPPRAAAPPPPEAAARAPVAPSATTPGAPPSKLEMLTSAIDMATKMGSITALTGLHGQIAEWPDKLERTGLKAAYVAAKAQITAAAEPTP